MGLPAAIKAHTKRDLKTAKVHYERALSQKSYSVALFQNYGALLREIGDPDRAQAVYVQGLTLYPESDGIKKNYINLLLEVSPAKALPFLFDNIYESFDNDSGELSDHYFVAIIDCLRKLGYFAWAYHVLYWSISVVGLTSRLAVQCVTFMCDNSYYSDLLVSNKLDIETVLLNSISGAKPTEKAELLYAMCWFKLSKSMDISQALNYLSSARNIMNSVDVTEEERGKIIKLNDINSWNASILLLQNQIFDIGWKLYDFGLRSPAKGAQAWQRALPKPFTHQEIPLWKGSSLDGKSLLLLEEQAIGDAMQFSTLVPSMLDEPKHLGLLVSNRLYPIYVRSFHDYISEGQLTVYSFDDVNTGKLAPIDYDYQSPLGSICQYRFTHPKLYSSHSPIISADCDSRKIMKDKYLASVDFLPKQVIGLSWRGGGTKDRMSQKSIPLPELANILRNYKDILFISLQYGDCSKDVNILRESGVNIILDQDVDAVNNFDHWLSQVAVCDSVISVANTTIHGSGGLNIPTLCMLTKYLDWRWLKDPTVDQSYWYPSVGIARQSDDGSWTKATSRLKSWIDSGCVQDWSTPYTMPYK